MLRRASSLILFTLILSYSLAIGFTYNGLMNPALRLATVIGLTALAALWFVARQGGTSSATSLDGAFVVWLGAFALSFAANMDIARRSAIGLWFMFVYIGVWYILSDLLSHRRVRRELLVDALLITGVVMLWFGFVQMQTWAGAALAGLASGSMPDMPPRPVSALGNPNTLAAFLVVLIPFALGRALNASSRVVRGAMGVYASAAGLLLLLTFSRAAWLGLAAGLAVQGVLQLQSRDQFSGAYWRQWWRDQRTLVRGLIAGAALVVLSVLAGGAFLFARTFTIGGRTLDLRTGIYESAFDLFAERPLFGQGLFTFGRGLVRFWSTPPRQLHSHAHNLPLNVAAELGVVGLVALAVTLVLVIFALRRNWRDALPRERMALTGATGACIAVGVHHLMDLPSMTPAIALTGIVALALAAAPLQPVPVTNTIRRLQSFALAGMWLVLAALGVWNAAQYQQYTAILSEALTTHEYRRAADALQPLIDGDPALAIYHHEQGLLYGMAADEGDLQAARAGTGAYERFVAIEPHYTMAWMNLAALYWQLGDKPNALRAAQRAVDAAPEFTSALLLLAEYQRASGDSALADATYARVYTLYPDIVLHPAWRGANGAPADLSTAAQVMLLLEDGNADEATALWATDPTHIGGTVPATVVGALIADAQGDHDTADALLDAARDESTSDYDETWILLGSASIAHARGDTAAASRDLSAIDDLLDPPPLADDYPDGVNIAYTQYLMQIIPHQFLPQTVIAPNDPLFMHLLERLRASTPP